MPRQNDLVISDSMKKSLRPNFTQYREVEVYPFSGMRAGDLNSIIKQQCDRGVMARSLLLCVGMKDCYCCVVNVIGDYLQDIIKIGDYFQDIIKIAKKMSSDVILCTVHHLCGKATQSMKSVILVAFGIPEQPYCGVMQQSRRQGV